MAVIKGILLIFAALEKLVRTAALKNDDKNDKTGNKSIFSKLYFFAWLNEKYGMIFILELSNSFSVDLFIGSWPSLSYIGHFWSTKIWISLAILLGMLIYYLCIGGIYTITAMNYIRRGDPEKQPGILKMFNKKTKVGLFIV